jgi:hypothetical protein
VKVNKKILLLILLGVALCPIIAQAQTLCSYLTTFQTDMEEVGGTVVIIGWIITGILYLTAGGGERLNTAKKALVACVIGTLVVILSTVIAGVLNTEFSLSGNDQLCSFNYTSINKTIGI